MKKAVLILILLILIVVGYLLVNRLMTKSEQEQKQKNITEIAVNVVKPILGKIVGTMNYTGTVEGINESVIISQTGGVVKQLNFQVGKRVGEATVLAVIENSQQSAGTEQAKAQLLAAESNYEKAQLDLKRIEKLQAESAISKDKVEFAQLGVKAAFAQLKGAQAALKVNEKQLADTYIKSTISGVISTKDIDKGATVAPGVRIARIVDNSKYKIKIMVSETDIVMLNENSPVKIKIDALPGKEFSGKVNTIGMSAESGMRSYPVEIVVEGKAIQEIKSGMFARCEIQSKSKENTLIIPINSVIQNNDGTTSVYIVENGKAILKQIKTGIKDKNFFEIVSGLSEDDNIVTEGKERLMNGMSVKEIRK